MSAAADSPLMDAPVVNQWISSLSNFFQNVGDRQEDQGIVDITRAVMNTPAFAKTLGDRYQLDLAFFSEHLCYHMFSLLSKDALVDLAAQLDRSVNSVFARIYGDLYRHSILVTPSVVDARLSVLQSSIHRKVTPDANVAPIRPVFYYTEGSSIHRDVESVAWELQQPLSAFRLVQYRRLTPAPADSAGNIFSYCINIAALEKLIDEDISRGLTPTAVFSVFGGNLLNSAPFQTDDITALRQVCDRRGMWLHVEGSSLVLAAAPASSSLRFFTDPVLKAADSVALEPLAWLGQASPAGAVLYRMPDAAAAPPAWFPPAISQLKLSAGGNLIRKQLSSMLGVWAHFAASSPDFVRNAVDHQLQLALRLKSALEAMPYPTLIGPPSADHPHMLFFQFVALSKSMPLSEVNADVNLFNKWLDRRLAARLNPVTEEAPSPSASRPSAPPTSTPRSTSVASAHFSAMAAPVDQAQADARADLDASATKLFESCLSQTMYQNRLGFLFHPLSSLLVHGSSCLHHSRTGPRILASAVDAVCQIVSQEIDALVAATRHRGLFEKAMTSRAGNPADITFIPMASVDHIVGLGAFRYTPPLSLSPEQLDHLNHLLGEALHRVNPLFTPATCSLPDAPATGDVAHAGKGVCIVAVTSPGILGAGGDAAAAANEIASLVHLVRDAISGLEVPQDVIDAWNEAIQKGIREANNKIAMSHVAPYYPTKVAGSLMRKLPVVGRLTSWFLGAQQQEDSQGVVYDMRSQHVQETKYKRRLLPQAPSLLTIPVNSIATPMPTPSLVAPTPTLAATPTLGAAPALLPSSSPPLPSSPPPSAESVALQSPELGLYDANGCPLPDERGVIHF